MAGGKAGRPDGSYGNRAAADPANGALEGARRRGSKFDTQPISTTRRRMRQASQTGISAQEALLGVPSDASLMPAARNALTKALGLRPGQTFVLIAEHGFEEIAAAFLRAGTEAGLLVRTFLVDAEACERDLFVKRVTEELAEADGSALVAHLHSLPADFRRTVAEIRGRRRHAHMVGVTTAMMRQSLRADYEEMDRLGERLIGRLRHARELRVRTGVGFELVLRTDPACRWYNGSGLLREPGFANLPSGEVSSSPASVDGELRADGGVWLPDGQVLGRAAGRADFTFEAGRVTNVRGSDGDAIVDVLRSDPNGARVGQMCFGTNVGVLTPVGAMLQDSKMPGFHLILGYSCPEHTGASWSSPLMVPLLLRRPDVSIDGQPVIVRGRYSRDLTG